MRNTAAAIPTPKAGRKLELATVVAGREDDATALVYDESELQDLAAELVRRLDSDELKTDHGDEPTGLFVRVVNDAS